VTPLLFIALALAGGLGAAARLLLDGVIRDRIGGVTPWGTIIINLTGSLLLGLISGLAVSHALPEAVHVVVGTGFLGGYTTFSTASFETIRLLQERRWTVGVLNGLSVLVATTVLAALGLWAGSLF